MKEWLKVINLWLGAVLMVAALTSGTVYVAHIYRAAHPVPYMTRTVPPPAYLRPYTPTIWDQCQAAKQLGDIEWYNSLACGLYEPDS